MEQKNYSDDELISYLDETLPVHDRERIEEKIKNDFAVQQRIKELETIHTILSDQKGIEHPSANFTEKVMTNLHTGRASGYFSPTQGMLLLLGLLVASGLSLALLSSSTGGQLPGLIPQEITSFLKNKMHLPTTSLDMKQIINGVTAVNLILAFILLDRTVLRPLFQKRLEGIR